MYIVRSRLYYRWPPSVHYTTFSALSANLLFLFLFSSPEIVRSEHYNQRSNVTTSRRVGGALHTDLLFAVLHT